MELDGDDVAAAVVALHRDLVSGARASTPDVLADVDPHEWRGIGPYGQGGKGMTGGVPHGRPLAGRAPDRDGLELDQLELHLGPWSPVLPPGLLLDVRLQGDVVQEASIAGNPYVEPPPIDIFGRALRDAVPLSQLERARAAHHLRWAAGVLRLLGLRAVAARLDRAAVEPGDDARRLATRLARARRLRPSMARIGVVAHHRAAAVGGPTARADGQPVDARLQDPAYASIGFDPVVVHGSDAWARWTARLEEAARSLAIAAAAGDLRSTPTGVVEAPRGPMGRGQPIPSSELLSFVPDLLAGLEWGDAVIALASLDIDVQEAATRPGAST